MRLSLVNFLKRNKNQLIVVVFSFIIFLCRFGLTPLNIFETNWIKNFGSDFGTELVSWIYYLHSPWTFPFTLSGYDYPNSTGIGMTGCIPFLSIPLKAIHSFSNENFQHFGWWFAFCYVLQGVFAFKILEQANENSIKTSENSVLRVNSILASLFFVIAPTFLFRWGHVHMNGHFLILAGLYYYFNSTNTATYNLKALLIVCILTSALHQYLAVMVFGIAFAGALQYLISKKIRFIRFLIFLVTLLASVCAVFYVVGDFIMPVTAQQNDGFGRYSSNINTFWNPLDYSKFIKSQPLAFNEQYEGFGYLGIGVLVLATLSLLSVFFFKSFREKIKVRFSSIVFVSLLIFIFTSSKTITFNHKTLFEIPVKDYTALGIFCNGFRASGRFIWVPYYVLMVGIFKLFLNFPITNYIKSGFLLALLGLQCFELEKLFKLNINHNAVETAFPTEVEKHIYDEAEKLIMYPPYTWDYKTPGDFFKFAYHTSEIGLPITTGYLARPNYLARNTWTNNFNAALDSGKLFDAHNVIIVSQIAEIGKFNKLYKQGDLQSFECNGYAILVPKNLDKTIQFLENSKDVKPLPFHNEFFSDFLKRHTQDIVLLAVSDEAQRHLTEPEKQYLSSIGSHIADSLRYGSSYIGLIVKGKSVLEQFENGKITEHRFLTNQKLGDFVFPKNIYLMSKGTFAGIDCSIKIDDTEYTHRNQGFNCLAIDAKGNVIEKCVFNTYLSSERAVFEK